MNLSMGERFHAHSPSEQPVFEGKPGGQREDPMMRFWIAFQFCVDPHDIGYKAIEIKSIPPHGRIPLVGFPRPYLQY
jgi:hypothetical protein